MATVLSKVWLYLMPLIWNLRYYAAISYRHGSALSLFIETCLTHLLQEYWKKSNMDTYHFPQEWRHMTSCRKIDKFKCPGSLLGGIFRSMTDTSVGVCFLSLTLKAILSNMGLRTPRAILVPISKVFAEKIRNNKINPLMAIELTFSYGILFYLSLRTWRD